jgi:PAS domain S-box-containing protein
MARKRMATDAHAGSAATRDADAPWDPATYQRLRDELRQRREDLEARYALFAATRRELTLASEDYQSLFDLGPVPCVILDANGLVRRGNDAAAELIATDRLRLSGMPFTMLIAEAHRRAFLQHIRQCRRGQESVTTTVTVRDRRGIELPVELVSRPFGRNDDDPALYHTVLRDLRPQRRLDRDRKLASEALRQVQQELRELHALNEAKDRFLAVLSHELRTPLTPILAATAAWKDDPSLPAAVRQALAMIDRNARVEARLIDDLLDLSRVTQGKLSLQPEVVDPHALVDEVAAALAGDLASAGIRLVRTLASTLSLCGDPLRLRQVVTNLLRNAIHFTPAGGCVTVETRDAGADRLVVTVSDTGVGFDPARAPRLFEAFTQGDDNPDGVGLGLGLAITKGLVEGHGGTIEGDSDGPNRGARFVVTLPATHARAGARPGAERPSTTRPSAGAAPLRVLLVEDHPDTSAALAYVLEHEGYRVECACSVAQALEAAAAHDVDVIVSDLGLPDGSGLDLMRMVQARKPTRGIALTGYGRREDLASTRAAGFDRHLTKPVDPTTLIAAIESLRPRDA